MSTNLDPPRRGAGMVPLLVAIGVACLVGGFVVGWFTRGDGGTASVLPAVSAPRPAATTAKTTTASPTPPTSTTAPEPREIALAVLNGTSVSGFAARTAARAAAIGYPAPTTGNAPTQTDPTTVYFRPGKRPAAQRVATDLGFTRIAPLPTTGPIATTPPATAVVVVVLGTG